MTWTKITRLQHDRREHRYASDYSDGEWVLIEPFLERRSRVGRPRLWPMRDIWNAVQYIERIPKSGNVDGPLPSTFGKNAR